MLAADRPPAIEIPKLKARTGLPRDALGYSLAERKQSVDLALKLAAKAASDAALRGHVKHLLTYARSVASGVVPGQIWQLSRLGFTVAPCNGSRNPHLLPRPEMPEPLTEAMELANGV